VPVENQVLSDREQAFNVGELRVEMVYHTSHLSYKQLGKVGDTFQ
jgi:hypothetical protein